MRRALAIFVLLVPVAGAHDVITTKITWSKEISRLLYKRCAVCHGEGSSIPLMTYDQARPWAVDIKDEVLTRQMPPWQAVKGFGAFKDDRGMTQEEMEYISDWVTGGAPEGNPKMLPKKSDPQQWRDPDSPAGSLEVDVAGGVKLGDSRQVLAVRPKGLAKGASVQVVAARPDGSFEAVVDLRFQSGFRANVLLRRAAVA